jgi:hypothetical protein
LKNLKQKVEIYETTKRKCTEALFLHEKQHEALDNHVKALTKENKEKENVLTNFELINLKKIFLLQSKELKRKIVEVEREQLMEDKKEYQKTL